MLRAGPTPGSTAGLFALVLLALVVAIVLCAVPPRSAETGFNPDRDGRRMPCVRGVGSL